MEASLADLVQTVQSLKLAVENLSKCQLCQSSEHQLLMCPEFQSKFNCNFGANVRKANRNSNFSFRNRSKSNKHFISSASETNLSKPPSQKSSVCSCSRKSSSSLNSLPPYPCRYCSANHWHSTCSFRPKWKKSHTNLSTFQLAQISPCPSPTVVSNRFSILSDLSDCSDSFSDQDDEIQASVPLARRRRRKVRVFSKETQTDSVSPLIETSANEGVSVATQTVRLPGKDSATQTVSEVSHSEVQTETSFQDGQDSISTPAEASDNPNRCNPDRAPKEPEKFRPTVKSGQRLKLNSDLRIGISSSLRSIAPFDLVQDKDGGILLVVKVPSNGGPLWTLNLETPPHILSSIYAEDLIPLTSSVHQDYFPKSNFLRKNHYELLSVALSYAYF